jgi:hypothetical protein
MFKKSLLIADIKLFLHHPIIRTRLGHATNSVAALSNHRLRGTISEFQCIFRFSALTNNTGGAFGHEADFCFVTLLICC